MSEYREYTISGDLTPDQWNHMVSFLGGLGVRCEMAPEIRQEAAERDVRGLPYSLAQITSPDQHLAYEHGEEFWPEYIAIHKDEIGYPPSKHEVLVNAFYGMFNMKSRAGRATLDGEARIAYAASLGLDLIADRSLIGFPAAHAPNSYSGDHIDPMVARVGSFIIFVDRMAETPTRERPWRLSGMQVKFLTALSRRLMTQIEPGPDRDTSPRE